MTPSLIRTLIAQLCLIPPFLALAFDPLGVVYEVAHLSRRDFDGTLGGAAPAITETGDEERPYEVDGNTFTDYDSAAQRSCNIQFDNCQRAANTDSSVSFSLEDCTDQQNDCFADPLSVEDSTTTTTTAAEEGDDDEEEDDDDEDDEESATATEVDTTDPVAVAGMVAQTTIAYDLEYDLVCDL
ncbi:hypothetical protein BJX99DRAFT_238611 [Aspergillus californicus]